MHTQMTVVSQALIEVGYKDLATMARTPIGDVVFGDLAKLVEREARVRNDNELIFRLEASGLIYKSRMTTLNKLNDYIDYIILDAHADKDKECGYSIDMDNIPPSDLHNLIDRLMAEHEGFNELIMQEVQLILNKRLAEYEEKDMEQKGVYRIVDRDHGDTQLRKAS